MLGTPILGTDTPGLAQHVSHRQTGYLVDQPARMEDVIKGIEYIRANFRKLSMNARKYYEELFCEANWARHYEWLLELLGKGNRTS